MQMIKTAYKKLSSFSHPDMVSPEHRQWAEERQKELNEAYRILSNPETRYEYDRAAGFHSYQKEAMRGRRPENNQSGYGSSNNQQSSYQSTYGQNSGTNEAAATAVQQTKHNGNPFILVGIGAVGVILLFALAPLLEIVFGGLLALVVFMGIIEFIKSIFSS
ncbi:hypothetical protein MTATph1_CDS0244 [Moorella phage MTATph1]